MNMCLTCFVDTLQRACRCAGIFSIDISTTYGSNLTTTIDTATDDATVDLDISDIDTTIIDITTTKDITTRLQVGVRNEITVFVFQCFINNILLIAIRPFIADVSIV